MDWLNLPHDHIDEVLSLKLRESEDFVNEGHETTRPRKEVVEIC